MQQIGDWHTAPCETGVAQEPTSDLFKQQDPFAILGLHLFGAWLLNLVENIVCIVDNVEILTASKSKIQRYRRS